MAVKIKFDPQHNPIPPTFVLMTKGGTKLGALPASDITFRTSMREYSEISFNVYKSDCHNIEVWNKLVDFRLLWVREWNMLYELQIDLTESSETVKAVQARSLGESELSQINLHGVEINTENDIARDDYKPTVLYYKKSNNETDEYDSLLNRLSEKIPHYEIDEVDASIAGIQRTFTFDGTSIYDAFQEIAEEIQCLFIIDCKIDESTGKISRKIKVKDLLSHCNDKNCGERGDFIDKCSKCGKTDITLGYGKDTAVFVSKDNLADEITYSTDCDKVKNCFRLEAGDDLMTATVANCNPNGSSYIWHFSDKMKEDMSTELQAALSEYDEKYKNYRDSQELLSGFGTYNAKVGKYNALDDGIEQHEEIDDPIIGYPQLMNAYYNVVDFRLFLESGLMPSVEMINTTAEAEFAKLSGKTVAVQSVSLDSVTTVSSAVKQFAKTIVDNRYNVEIIDTPILSKTTLSERNWKGTIKVTNAADENDATSGEISMTVTDDVATYTQQRIDKLLEKKVTTSDSATDVKALFQKNDGDFVYGNEASFTKQIEKYSLSRLSAFHDACQACLDIMIEQGMADASNKSYKTLYLPYYNRLGWLAAEIKKREEDINVVKATEERILQKQVEVQNELDIETCLGSELWLELMSFRREGTYSNENYISDGLTNEELFKNAQDFISVAENEIYKSSTLQHTISSSLKNLLFIKEFEPIVENFEVGNWIRVKIDGKVYRLRLLEYEISFEEPENITVTFSDVTETKTGVSDIESILDQAASMASSYDAVARQSRVGKDAKKMLDGWVKDGLSLTNSKIINNADEQQVTMDNHGLLCREYLPITDEYDKKQLKIINRGLYLTDDNWETARAGIGNFVYVDPTNNKTVSAYGVIADTIIGKIILSEKVGIYNSSNSVSIDKNGFKMTVGDTTSPVFNISKKDGSNILSVDSSGNLSVKGDITATGGTIGGFTIAKETIGGTEFGYLSYGTAGANGGFVIKPRGYVDEENNPVVMQIGKNFKVQADGTVTASSLKIAYSNVTGTPDLSKYIKLGFKSGDTTPSGSSHNFDYFGISEKGVLTASNALIYGTIYASNGEFTGNITATGGSIGGFTISKDGYLSYSTVGGNGGFLLDPQLKLKKQKTLMIGSKFSVDKDGVLSASGATISGNITATSLTIVNNATIPVSKISGAATSSELTTVSNTASAAKDKADNSVQQDTSYGGSGTTFQVTSSGHLTATGATISGNITANSGSFTGKITATEGSFGVWNIGTGSSKYTNVKGIYTFGEISSVKYEIGLKSDFTNATNLNYYVCKKNGEAWDTLFSVSNEGRVVASNSSVGGWKIGDGSYYYSTDKTICRTTYKADKNKAYTIPFIEVGLKNQSGQDNVAAFYIIKNTNSSTEPNYIPKTSDWTIIASITQDGSFNTYSGRMNGLNGELNFQVDGSNAVSITKDKLTFKVDGSNAVVSQYIQSGSVSKLFVQMPQLPTCTISGNAANVFVNDSGSLYKSASSSLRYKTQISKQLSDELNPHGLYDVAVVEYMYKDEYLLPEDIHYHKKVIGIIAEDIEAHFPIAASYNQDGSIENWNERFIVPGMLKLIQEQNEQIEELKNQVSYLMSKSA